MRTNLIDSFALFLHNWQLVHAPDKRPFMHMTETKKLAKAVCVNRASLRLVVQEVREITQDGRILNHAHEIMLRFLASKTRTNTHIKHLTRSTTAKLLK